MSDKKDDNWAIEEEFNGRVVRFTKDEALIVVCQVPTSLKGVDGKMYCLLPSQRSQRAEGSQPAKRQVTVLTSAKLFPFWKHMRHNSRPLIKYNGPKPERGRFKIIAPSISASSL